jgi:tetratricopeptide (TPR) repeat protein
MSEPVPQPIQNPATTTPTPNPSPAQAEIPKRGPSGRRKWIFRLAAIILVPLVIFGVLELGLRLGGYGKSSRFFLDGSALERSGVWIDNREFGRWVFPRGLEQTPFPVPFVLAKEKRPGTFRVFVLGESAAMGFPEPSISFPRVLDTLLTARYPDTRFEVVNTAMVAINSHIVLPIARECADRDPDLFVVHLGNNEVVGPYGASGVLGPYSPSRRMIRASLAVRQTRTGQLLSSLVQRIRGGEGPKVWSGMAMFVNSQVRVDDTRLPKIFDHFRENLGDICRVGTNAGVPVVVCTIPVNLKDSAPFGSLHAPNLGDNQLATWNSLHAEGVRLEGEGKFADALAKYQEASVIDSGFAALVFRQARCLAAQGKEAVAKEQYAQARDLDTLRFRSDSTINRTIREVISERAGSGVYLADAEGTFEANSPAGLPGENLFLEHVHMNFSGNYLMAKTVFQAITPILDTRLSTSGGVNLLTEEQCALRLAHTLWNESKIISQVQGDLFHQPPFTDQLDRTERAARWEAKVKAVRAQLKGEGIRKAVNIYQQALTTTENDWMIRMNYGLLLSEIGELQAAEEQYKSVLKSFRHCFPAHCRLGQIMLRMGQPESAEIHFREALKMVPDLAEAHIGLAEVLGASGKVDEGLAIYEDRLRKDPDMRTTLVAMGAYLIRAGRLDEAKRRLEESLQLGADNPNCRVYLGDIALKQGNKTEALAHYEAALRLRPDWPELQARINRMQAEAKGLPPK